MRDRQCALNHDATESLSLSQNGVIIFRAELYAITMALNIIYRRKENKFIIFSDSMSSLQAVKASQKVVKE